MWKKTKKKILWFSLFAAVLSGVIVWWQMGARAEEKPKVEKVPVQRGDLVLKVSGTGVVEPEYVVEIKPKASGEVEEVKVQAGDHVKKGQLLVTIDPIVETRRVSQAKAELRMVQASYSSIRHKINYTSTKLKREKALLKKGLVARESVDSLKKEYAVLRAEASLAGAKIQKAKEELSEAKDRLSETEIKAPVRGTVLERLVQPGQIVASGTNSVSGGTALLRVADLQRLFIRVQVDEVDVSKVKVGMKTAVTADAHQGKRFGGRVLRVAPQGKEENNVTVFEVLVEVDKAGSEALRPRMTADVEILVAERREALLLPKRVVRRRAGSEWGMVRTPGGGKKRIRLGLDDGVNVEVLSGLNQGDEVAIEAKKTKGRGRSRGKRHGGQKSRRMRRMMRGRR